MTLSSSIGNFLSSNSGTIGGLLTSGAQMYGQQNAGQSISKAADAGIGTANTTMGNINALYKPQTTLGSGAMTALGSSLGINGQPANYNNFLNMPGYQFAVQQGTQAIQRQAASMGSAYTPNTAQAVGQYVTGTAMQDYNNYISQLQAASQLGSAANQNLTSANLETAGNIEQLGQNAGMAQAGMYTGMGQTGAGAIGSTNGSGVGGGSGGGGTNSLISSGVKMLGNWLSGSSLGAFASGAPADAATSSALGSVGSQTAGTSANIAASNDAALQSQIGSYNAGTGANSAGLTNNFGNISSSVGSAAGDSLAAYGSGAAADSAVTGALGSVGAQTAGTAAGIQAGNDAALASQLAAEGGGSSAAGSSAATTGAMGAGAGAMTAVAGAALPLALAALVPYNSGFSNSEVQGMLGNIKAATAANGGELNAGSGISNGMIADPKLASAFQDLNTLIGTNSDEFTKAGGQNWIYQQLADLGYGNLLQPGENNPLPSNSFARNTGTTTMNRARIA